MSRPANAPAKAKRPRSDAATTSSSPAVNGGSQEVSLALFSALGDPSIEVRVDAAAKLVAVLQAKQKAHRGGSSTVAGASAAKKTKTDAQPTAASDVSLHQHSPLHRR
jgi:hypothetical protein